METKDYMRVSVKQIEMCLHCPRKWAYHYLERVPQVQSEAGVIGEALHGDMARMIRGMPVRNSPESSVGKMCRELYQYATPRSSSAVAEIVRMVPLDEWQVKVHLRCDLMDRELSTFKDWKTTGAERASSKLRDGRLWALGDLTNDFQANIYAFLLMHAQWKTNAVVAEWCFVSKKFKEGQTPRTWRVQKAFMYADVRLWWDTYCVPTINLMRDLRTAWKEKQLDSALLVPHNPASCEFTGHFCDAAGRCGVRMRPSPIGDYSSLHLPILPTSKGKHV